MQTFSNDNIVEVIDEGRVKVDGICYILDTTRRTATVTYQNSGYNSYSGTVTVPSTVEYEGTTYTITAIGQRAFSDCVDLEKVEIGTEVTDIEYGAFNLCSASTVTFAEGSKLRNIANYAFNGAKLTRIVLPEGFTTLGSNVFNSCSSLESVSLPSTLTSMGQAAFNYCLYMEDVWVSATTPLNLSLSTTPFAGVNDYWLSQFRLHVPKGSKEAYAANEVWRKFSIVEYESGETDPDPGTVDPGTDPDQPLAGSYTIQLSGTDLYFSTLWVQDGNYMTYSLSREPEYFYINETAGGYTIQSATTERYAGFSAKEGNGLSTWDFCDKNSVWTISSLDGTPTLIIRQYGSVGFGADDAELYAGVYTNKQKNLCDNCYWIIKPVGGTTQTVDITSLTFSESAVALAVGDTYTVPVSISPSNATNKTLAWKSYNEAVATVAAGVVTAVGPGTATITAEATDGSGCIAFMSITVTERTEPVVPTPDEAETVYTFSPSTDATRYFSTDEFIEKGRPTYCLSSTPEYFRVKKVEGGYTIQSTKTGQYAGISTDKHWDFADEPTVWNISALTGTVSILRATGETTKGFGWDSDGSTYTDKEDMQWTINAVPYSGDSAGLVANMVRRAIGGKCGKADVEATVQSVLQKSAAE